MVFLLFGMISTAVAQNYEAQLLEEIVNAYEALHYVEVEIKAKAALEEYERFTASQLSEIHKILALVYFSQNKPIKARQHFENALSINPDLKLDTLFVSPKILEFYDQIKLEHDNEPKNDTRPTSELRYILVQDPRPAAALRSMILPGWGQIYKGDKRKGIVLSTLWGVSAIGTIVTHFARENAQDHYLSETDPTKIESIFNTFNTFHKLRNSLLLFSAGVWLYSYFDAFLKNSGINVTNSPSKKSFSIVPIVSKQQANLTVLFVF